MPYEIRKRGERYCVVLKSSGKAAPGGCHNTRAAARKHLAALVINIEEASTKALEDILLDDEFWAQQRRRWIVRMQPMFRLMFLAGAVLGARTRARTGTKQEGLGELETLTEVPDDLELLFDEDLINIAADDFVARYTNTWWEGFSASVQRRMRQVFQQAAEQGLTTKDVIALLEPEFGEARAERIAVSEMTNLMGGGAQATFAAAGFGEWEWLTVLDARVDPVCADLEGQRFPMSTLFERAHVGCRCRPAPIGDVGQPAQLSATPSPLGTFQT